jgi:hypothetical protein
VTDAVHRKRYELLQKRGVAEKTDDLYALHGRRPGFY